ncbi:hypothetical protein [Leptolinea tardivitalis]|uniref:PsbP C-terminal domain-containing protein n=1 Tax=Leptolinea tardivitalis TaxID=229920 RepID=A0A0P6X0L2_9CHLR|nr:hypothetical protein [Leptolinea tardivitalis]KPL72693.1 hypothetical protein ADM99_06295 [Leptolinea tardivitalis]GAP20966.1 hypothetical protein LTAR_01170 [Leptolinea tardivitalis]
MVRLRVSVIAGFLLLILGCRGFAEKTPSAVPDMFNATATFFPQNTPSMDISHWRKFEAEGITLKYPDSWKTVDQVSGRPLQTVENKEFHARLLIKMTNAIPSSFGEKYTAWCDLMEKGFSPNTTTQEAMKDAYTILDNYPDSVLSEQPISIAGRNAIEKIYRRPRGEPWYQVRDVWIEDTNRWIILSCYSSPGKFESNNVLFETILNNLEIKTGR